MKLSIFFATMLLTAASFAQGRHVPSRPYYGERGYQVESEIRQLTREINDAIRSGYLTEQQLVEVRNGLQMVRDTALNVSSTSDLICTKQSNGLFYPTDSQTGGVVGSTSYLAGYGSLDSCRETMPARFDVLACMKQSNGLYYPSNPKSGAVVGSSSYQAGYGSVAICKETLPKRGSKISCFKQSNGLFYPSNPETGAVIGSSSYQAGYGNLQTCLQVVSQ